MRSLALILPPALALLSCASQTPPQDQHSEANRFCTQRCEDELGNEDLEGFYSCEVLCECAVDALTLRYPDEDVATLLAMLDSGQREPPPELEEVGRHCALQASFLPASDLDPAAAAWYSQHLRAAGEPRVEPTGRDNVEIYRLLVLPSFSPTIVVRVERIGPSMTFTTKRLSGAGGYEPGEIDWQAEGTVSSADWTEFKRLLIAADFWVQLSHDALVDLRMERCHEGDDSACWMGLDGTMWVLEGADQHRYHVVDRHDAAEPPLQKAFELLLSVTGNTSR